MYLTYSTLNPLLILEGPWLRLGIDFITDLLRVDGYDGIIIMIDLYMKMAYFEPVILKGPERKCHIDVEEVVKIV